MINIHDIEHSLYSLPLWLQMLVFLGLAVITVPIIELVLHVVGFILFIPIALFAVLTGSKLRVKLK